MAADLWLHYESIVFLCGRKCLLNGFALIAVNSDRICFLYIMWFQPTFFFTYYQSQADQNYCAIIYIFFLFFQYVVEAGAIAVRCVRKDDMRHVAKTLVNS